jgi:hypothetical protein
MLTSLSLILYNQLIDWPPDFLMFRRSYIRSLPFPIYSGGAKVFGHTPLTLVSI